MRLCLSLVLASLVGAVLLPPQLRAGAVIYSTLDPGDGSYDSTVAASIMGAGSPPYTPGLGYQSAGGMFTAGISASINEIDLALLDSYVNVYLFADSAGVPGGSPLASWIKVTPAGDSAYCNMDDVSGCILTVLTGMSIPVTQGQSYWILAEPNNNNTFASWNQSLLDPGTVAHSIWASVPYTSNPFTPANQLSANPSGVWDYRDQAVAFQVLTDGAVPEPSSLLLGLGGAGLLLLRRRSRVR